MKYIAERKLLCAAKGSRQKHEITVRISEPFIVDDNNSSFPTDGVASGCYVEMAGLDEGKFDFYGMDSLQAVSIASNIDPLLERLSKKYDFFWLTGEEYFDD